MTWDDLTNGFEHVPGGNAYRNRSVLSYHFYRPPNVSKHRVCIPCKLEQHPHVHCFPFKYITWSVLLLCVQISPNLTFTGRMDDLKRLGCAGFLTEFGIGGISDMFYEVLDEADLNLQVCGRCLGDQLVGCSLYGMIQGQKGPYTYNC